MKGLLAFKVLILALLVVVAYSLTLLDNIVHGLLYNYGLQFSYDWAVPYWTILRTIQALMVLAALFSLTSTVYVYRKFVRTRPRIREAAGETELPPSSIAKEQKSQNVSRAVKCVHCGKIFAQPLRMLDFHSDRPRIINICPFCNEALVPGLRQEESERVKKAVQKEKKNNHAKVVQESQEAQEARSKDEAEETVATTAQ